MYIPKYKKRQIVKWIITIVTIVAIAFIVNSLWYRKTFSGGVVAQMNKLEHHYDADGPFIMINTKDNIIGFYIGSTPIAHYEFTEDIEEGIYDVEYDDYAKTLDLKKKSGEIIGSIDTKNNIEIINNFKEAIVLVYE